MKLGLFSLLTIVFVIAKLTGYVSWSWWIVLSPAFVGAGLGLLMLIFLGICAICANIR